MSRDVVVLGGPRVGRSLRKCLQPLFNYAQANGWTVARTNGGHLRFTKPGRPIIHTGGTPSDWRSVRNALAYLARADRMVVVERPNWVGIYHG